MMTPDVNVFLINFPGPEREAVTHNEDDSYSIFINARLSDEGRLQAYEHAMKHIMNGDFDAEGTNVQEIEVATHKVSESSDVPAVPSIALNTIRHPIRKKRRRNRKKERYVQERTTFLMEHCNMFAMAEHNYLYGKDY